MKSKKTVLMILLAFVLVLGGASVLYNRLGENLAPEQLAEQAPQASEPVSDNSAGSGESEPEKGTRRGNRFGFPDAERRRELETQKSTAGGYDPYRLLGEGAF